MGTNGCFSELVDGHRQDRIGMLVKGLYGLTDKLRHGSGCTVECDSFHLGTLMIHMTQCKLYPRPSAPYDGVSIAGICKMVKEFGMSTTRVGVCNACHEGQRWQDRNACQIGNAVQRIMKMAKLEYNLGVELG